MLNMLEISAICKRCHRKLKDIESIKLGYGKICYKKIHNSKNYLFELEENKDVKNI